MGRGHPGVPTLCGEQRHRTTRAPSCCGRASLRIRGARGPRGGGGQAGGQRSGPAATPPSRLVAAQAAGAGALEGWQGAF